MSQTVPILITFALGVTAAWAMTVPLHRFKELRPKSPRDIDAEVAAMAAPATGSAPAPGYVPVATPRPHIVRAAYRHALCPSCHHEFTAADVIPVASWATGCPQCHTPLPMTVPMLQIGTGAAAAITAATTYGLIGSWVALVPFLWLVVALAAIALVDLRIWLIPYWMPWVASGVGVALIAVSSIAHGKPAAILYSLGGGAALFAVFFVLWLVAPAKLGFSDVRLSLLIGLFLGWLDPILPIYGLLFGSVIALGVGLVSIARKRGSRFAFGPALALGTLCAIWFAGSLIG